MKRDGNARFWNGRNIPFGIKICIISTGFLVLLGSAQARSEVIEFTPEHWTFFQAQQVEHLGQKALRGSAVLKDVEFENGTIEFDVAFTGARTFGGVMFRMQSLTDYEDFYLRPHKTGFPDALQYTPVFKGLAGWQLYNGPGYTALAAIPHKQWVHVRLEVKGSQARVFLDEAQKPALVINDLKHGAGKGGLGLKGPANGLAHFANFSYKADDTLEFPPPPKVSPPPGIITKWEISPAYKLTQINRELSPEEQDLSNLKWLPAETEPTGLLNIARFIPHVGQEPDCVLIRRNIPADKEEIRKFVFGYSDEVSLFLNGKILFRGKAQFRLRDAHFQGVVGLHDAVFLPLVKGDNELILMVTETFGGWGIMGQLAETGDSAIRPHPSLAKAWESEAAFKTPESVLYDPGRDRLYVSNYQDPTAVSTGNDAISLVGTDGTIIKARWVEGLSQPTGMTLKDGTLYVVERKNLVEIDTGKAVVTARHPIPEAAFPNDAALDSLGRIYISDSRANVIHRYDGTFEVWLKSPEIRQPNGLLIDGDSLIWGNSGDGTVKAADINTKAIRNLAELGPSVIDGLQPDGRGNILVSDWNGRIYRLDSSGGKQILLDTTAGGVNLADFAFIPKKGLFVIPTFTGNRLLAYAIDLR
jgi:sugar lactone lactonase YvrE